MNSLAAGLPVEIAAQVHPDWRANEKVYWEVRDSLLPTHRGKWIAFADSAIISSSNNPLDVFEAAQLSGRHPYVARVGFEEEPCHMRRMSISYDTTYSGVALPQANAEFRAAHGVAGIWFDRLIPDTGADASAIPWSDCVTLGLDPALGSPGRIGGVGGSSAATLAFVVWVWLDGQEYTCRLQADFVGQERILGRDVLNQLDVLFRGPAGEVVFNP